MDEVGLSSRVSGKPERDHQHSNGNTPYHERSRPISQQGSRNGQMQHSPLERQNSAQFLSQQQYNSPVALDPNYDQFSISSPIYAAPNAVSQQQMQYQQALLAAQGRGISPGNVYGGYPSPAPSFDNFRQTQPSPMPQQVSSSPMMQHAGYAPPGFGPMVSGGMMGGYAPYQGMYFPQQGMQQQQQQAGGRRGRVSLPRCVLYIGNDLAVC